MPNFAALSPFRQLVAVGPFTRNVDALFQDFFHGPLSLDATATGQPALDTDTDIADDPCGQEAAAPDAAMTWQQPGAG